MDEVVKKYQSEAHTHQKKTQTVWNKLVLHKKKDIGIMDYFKK